MINRKIEPQHDEGTRSGGTNLSKGVPAWSKCPLGSAPPRLLCLPRARLAALGSSALPGRGRPTGLPATAASRLQKAAPAVDHSGVRKSVAPDGSGQLGTPRKRPAHWVPSHGLGCSSEPSPKPPISPPLTVQAPIGTRWGGSLTLARTPTPTLTLTPIS